MSELEANGQCPFCKSDETFMFSGSGSNATCPKCGKNIKSYRDLIEGEVIAYNG